MSRHDFSDEPFETDAGYDPDWHLDPSQQSTRRYARKAQAHQETGANGSQQGPKPFTLGLIDSASFETGDYSLSWLVKKVLVKGQPCILGGPKKSLKTSIGVDLAVSVAGGRPFLGEFFTPGPCRVCVLSGESGQATLQSLARRVAASKGLRLANLDILWGFTLPQLADPLQVDVLRESVEVNKIGLLLFDPLYLALLAGQGPGGLSASNLYQMGPLLLSVAQACLAAGCTPVLFHHFRTTRNDPYAVPQLEDLVAPCTRLARLTVWPRGPYLNLYFEPLLPTWATPV
jgi:hypothetical protein